MAQTTRTIKLILDTRDGQTSNSDTSEVRWNVGSELVDVNRGVNWVQVASAEIPHTFYNITSRNYTIEFEVWDATGTIPLRTTTATLAVGDYDSTALLTQVKIAMDTADADTYTITLDALTGVLSILNDAGNQIVFKFDASTAGRVLGWLKDSSKGTTISGERPIDLRGATAVVVHSNIASKNTVVYSGVGGSSSQTIANIPITADFGSTIYWENNNELDVIQTRDVPSSVWMRMRTHRGDSIDLNKFDWKISLLINYNLL